MQVTPQLFPAASELRSGQLVRLTNGKRVRLIIQATEQGWYTDGKYLSKEYCEEYEVVSTYDECYIEASQVESILSCPGHDFPHRMNEYESLVSSYNDGCDELLNNLMGEKPMPKFEALKQVCELEENIADAIGTKLYLAMGNPIQWADMQVEVISYLEEKESEMQAELKENEEEYWKEMSA
jgi:hypothetical protein